MKKIILILMIAMVTHSGIEANRQKYRDIFDQFDKNIAIFLSKMLR
jgi:hypothetical protein